MSDHISSSSNEIKITQKEIENLRMGREIMVEVKKNMSIGDCILIEMVA